jgi:NADP-dependent 3-hydroxy acid dehydrogenase YdfG
MPGRLEGKVALVTGASSGIGEATALALGAVTQPEQVDVNEMLIRPTEQVR